MADPTPAVKRMVRDRARNHSLLLNIPSALQNTVMLNQVTVPVSQRALTTFMGVVTLHHTNMRWSVTTPKNIVKSFD